MSEAIWIKDPLAILADGAERGVVVAGGQIVELVPQGRRAENRRGPRSTPARTSCCRA